MGRGCGGVQSPLLQALASREELVRNGKLTVRIIKNELILKHKSQQLICVVRMTYIV